MNKKNILIGLVVVVALIGLYFVAFPIKTQAPIVDGGVGDGARFVSEKVIVDNIGPNDLIMGGIIVTGKARGYYFEASFPVTLVDGNGKVILQTYAEAQSDWMTADFVPFKTTLNFVRPETATGKLILAKDNPSGLPEHDEQVEIPVKF